MSAHLPTTTWRTVVAGREVEHRQEAGTGMPVAIHAVNYSKDGLIGTLCGRTWPEEQTQDPWYFDRDCHVCWRKSGVPA